MPKAIKGAIFIPNGITAINNSLFQNCSNITSIELADSVTRIGDNAFNNCSGLNSVKLPSNITEISANAFYGCDNITSATISTFALDYLSKTKLQTVVINGGASIDERAFYNCANLTSIALNSASTIGSQAFYNCSSLTMVDIPSGVTSVGNNAFYGCSNLTRVYITDIKSWCEIEFENAQANPLAFANKLYLNNVLLTSLEIPDEVTSIGDYTFYGCSGLTEINMTSNLTHIGVSAFVGCDNIVTATIPTSAISSLSKSKMQSIIINGGDQIVNGAFADCTNLVSVDIPSSVTFIGSTAFSGCAKLGSIRIDANNAYYTGVDGILYNKQKTEIILIPKAIVGAVAIPNGVRSISSNAFSDCIGLTSVEIPSSVATVGEDAFSGCDNLTGVNITDVASWCGVAFANAQANPLAVAQNLYIDNEPAMSLVIPDTVTSIGDYAFYGFSGVTSIYIPSKITSIGTEAFKDCDNITSTTLPTSALSSITKSKLQKVAINGGEEITSGTFMNCGNLTSVDMGNSVTSIGQFAFSGCTGLQSIKIPSSVTSIAWRTFDGCSNLTSVTFENTSGWYYAPTGSDFNSISANVTNPSINATNITSKYLDYYWICNL